MGYRIGSLNVRNLSKTALGSKSPRDLKKIAEIIRKEHFDVVALQEVLSEGAAFDSPEGTSAKRSILMELGPDWRFMWADVSKDAQTADQRREGYAFLWNSRRLRLAETVLDDNTRRTFYPRICNRKTDSMMRKPYYARFTASGLPGGSNFELRLICVHTYYGDDTNADRIKRRQELETLLTKVYPYIDSRPYKSATPDIAYTVILGDYNAELIRPWKLEWKRHRPPLYVPERVESSYSGGTVIKTAQYELTTLRLKEDEDDPGAETRRYTHDYDHFSYSEKRFQDFVGVKTRRVDAIRKYCDDDAEKYRATVSDHIPIVMSIELK